MGDVCTLRRLQLSEASFANCERNANRICSSNVRRGIRGYDSYSKSIQFKML
eukprot:IDg17798t1